MPNLNSATGNLEGQPDDEFSQYLSGLFTGQSSLHDEDPPPEGPPDTPDPPNTPTPPPPDPTPTPPPTDTPTPPAIPPPTGGTSPVPLNTGPRPDLRTLINNVIHYGPGLPPTSASLDNIISALQAQGINAKRASRAGGNGSSDDKLDIDGQIIDLIRDVGGAGADWQYSEEAPGGTFDLNGDTRTRTGGTGGPVIDLTGDTRTKAIPDPNGGAGGGAGGAGGTGGTGGAGAGGLDGFLAQLMSQYQSLFDRYSRPVSRDDPNISPILSARQGATGRALNRYREMAAERAHAEGVGSGAFDSQLGNAQLSAGQSEGEFEGSVLENEQARRDQVLSSIFGQGLGLGSLGSSNQLGNRSLSITDFLGRGGLSNQLFLGTGNLAARLKELSQNDAHFYDDLAAKLGLGANSTDAQLLKLLLSGGF